MVVPPVHLLFPSGVIYHRRSSSALWLLSKPGLGTKSVEKLIPVVIRVVYFGEVPPRGGDTNPSDVGESQMNEECGTFFDASTILSVGRVGVVEVRLRGGWGWRGGFE